MSALCAPLAATSTCANDDCNLLPGLRLDSHFQPIFSLAHRRPIGHEALLRASDKTGPISPLALFDRCPDFDARLQLDQLSRQAHLRHFAEQNRDHNWLFLNMDAEVFLLAGRFGALPQFEEMLADVGLFPQQIVVELRENAVADDADFSAAVNYFRSLGCLLALDDFGAGHSNFDRVWQIQPEIVKLDRKLITQAGQNRHICRMLVQIASLLHESGALVLMEGIETHEEASIALEADIDFVQGYYFGRPQPQLLSCDQLPDAVAHIWQNFDSNWQAEHQRQQQFILPYVNAIGYASVLLSAGRSMAESCASFLQLEAAEFCYLLNARGEQIGPNLWGEQAERQYNLRFLPLDDASGARWALRPYFRHAIDNFGRIQISSPYLSLSGAGLCVTLSVSFKYNDEKRVLCGDICLTDDP